MITFFSAPKPFAGHIGVIQRNAIRSWTLLHPDVEVILFGNEKGTAEVAQELGVRHEADVARNEFGTPLLHHIFRRAQETARHEWVCYSNADIIQTQQFRSALVRPCLGRAAPATLAGAGTWTSWSRLISLSPVGEKCYRPWRLRVESNARPNGSITLLFHAGFARKCLHSLWEGQAGITG